MPPRKSNTETKSTPQRIPKQQPKQGSKPAPDAKPDDTLKHTPKQRPKKLPKPAPIIAPVLPPENYTISIYSLPHWDDDHSTSPRSYGNGGRAIGEFHTEADAKEWLRLKTYFGHFAAVERNNGRIGKSWHLEIEPGIISDDADGLDDDLGMLDEDDLDDSQLLNPEVVRSKIEIAKLKAELKATSRNGAHTTIGETLQLIKTAQEMHGQSAQQKSLAEQLREIKEVNEIISPRREQSQQPAPQSQLSDEVVILNALANNDAVASKVKDLIRGVFSSSAEKEEITLAEVAMEAVKNGEASRVMGAIFGGLQNIIATILPGQAQGQPDPHAQHTQQVTQESVQQTQSIPTNAQQSPISGEAQQTAGADVPAFERLFSRLLPALAMSGEVEPVVSALDSFIGLYPEHQSLIENLMSAPAEGVLQFLALNVPNAAPVVNTPHAVEWMQKLQAAFFSDGDQSDDDDQASDDQSQKGAQS